MNLRVSIVGLALIVSAYAAGTLIERARGGGEVLASPGPELRLFVAETLLRASPATKREILDGWDFSEEKDKNVLRQIVRAADDVMDEAYTDSFVHLAQCTDLYNDTRHWIAFKVAGIGGTEGRAGLDEFRLSGEFERIMPALESIYSPPATGLLITNAMSPEPSRMGLYDVVLEYNGHQILTHADIAQADLGLQPGQVVTARVLRNGAIETLNITVTNTAPGHLHFGGQPMVSP